MRFQSSPRHAARVVGCLVAVGIVAAATVACARSAPVPASAAEAPPAHCRLPAPDPAHVGNEHEGTTDYTRWLRPSGTLHAAVVFVDFPDAKGTARDLASRQEMLHGASAWLAASSYGRVSMQLQWTTGWAEMPSPTSAYQGYNTDFLIHQRYMQDGVTASDAAVNFSDIDLLYLVPPPSATSLTTSPAFIASPGYGVHADGVTLRHGAALGQDLTTWGYKVLIHETGHTFGLPDLYLDHGPDKHRLVGGWDLMGYISGQAPDHLAWHKWKMGWLRDVQIACVTGRHPLTRTLSPLGESPSSGGIKAVVVRTGPTRAVVVENRQVSELDQGGCFRRGALVYVVDASVGGGQGPVQVLDPHKGPVPGCAAEHARLDNATLNDVGDEVIDPVSGVAMRLTDARGGPVTVQIRFTK